MTRMASSYQIISQAEGIINYRTSRNIEGVTKFNNLGSLIRELQDLFLVGATVEQVRICGNTVEGHQYLARILPEEICFGLNLGNSSREYSAESS